MQRPIHLLFLLAGLVAMKVGCGGRTDDAPPPIDSAPLDGEVVSACTRLMSCPSGVTHASVSECLLVNAGPFMNPDRERIVTGINALSDTRSASMACINGAADCAAISVCATGKHGDCAELPPGRAVCEGNRHVSCRGGARSEIDCTTKDCELTRSCDAQPKAAACIVVDGGAECGFEPCSEETFQKVCVGSELVVCQSGVVKHVECSWDPTRVAATCGERPGGGVGCIVLTPTCSPESRAHCEGSDVVSCVNGREMRRACESYPIPMVCGVQAPCGPDKSCVTCVPSPRLRCDPRKHVDRCNGTRLVYCDGQERDIDCVSLGFSECISAAGNAVCR